MRVPVRRLPDTRVSERQQGFARGVQPLDVTPIRQLAEGFRDQLLDEQDDRQRVELNRRLLQEVNELQTDFAARRTNTEISPIDFAASTNAAYTERHNTFMQGLREEGYSQDLLDDFEGRLGAIRQGFFERGLGHQLVQLESRAVEEINDLGTAASQYAAANPNEGYVTAREMLQESIRAQPDLTEDRRAALENQQLAILRDSAGRALVIQDSQFIIDTLDPQGLTAPYSAATPGTTGGTTVNTEGMDGDRSAVATTLSAGGLSPQVVAGFLGNFDVEGGYSGALGDNGTASGIAQWRAERRANFIRQFGKEPHRATLQEQAQFVLWELNNPAQAGMTAEQANAIRNARTAEEAAELIDRYYERSSGEHRSRRVRAANGYTRVQTASVQSVDLPPSTAPQQSDAMAGVERPEAPTSIADVRTGHALLDDLTGSERLQLLARAREQTNRVTATQRAEMDVRIGNITAEMGNGIATPLPTEQELLAVYGPVEGPQRFAQIQQAVEVDQAMQGFATQSATDIQRALDALEPEPGSPAYEVESQIYQVAERAATALMNEREQDPAAYAMRHFPAVREAARQGTAQYYAAIDRAYQTLGINPRHAPVMPASAVEELTEDYRRMNPQQRQNFMRQNFSQMGEDRFRRFVSDMEGTTAETDARVFALLRTYPNARGGVGVLFRQVLEGREIIAQDPSRRPRADQIATLFNTNARNGTLNLDPDTSRTIQEATEALYAYRGGDPVNVDGRFYREALSTVLGGNLPYAMQGSSRDLTILPPGVDGRQFEAWVERQSLVSLTRASVGRRPPLYGDLRTPVPLSDIIDEGAFVMTSPGHYMIKMADGRPLMTGSVPPRPFIVNINPREVVR